MSVRLTAQRLAGGVAALALVAACGSSGSSKTGATGANPAPVTGSASAGGQTSGGPALAELAAQKTVLPALPPVTASPGKSAWIISCGTAAAGCAFLSNGISTVMHDQLKWQVTTFDGKLTPATYSAGINQALVAHADAIVLVAIDCSLVKPALVKAKAAGVPVIDAAGYDCSDPSQGGGPSLITASDPGGAPDIGYTAQGKTLADYVAAQSGGTAKMIVATLPDFHYAAVGLAAFKQELAKVCPGCKILQEAPALGVDLVSAAAEQKFSSALLQQPSANYVVATQEIQLSYITNALKASGRHVTLLATGGSFPSEVQQIKDGTITGMVPLDINLQAWVTTDYVVRSLAKTATVPVPGVYTFVDKTHNLPTSGGFTAQINYQAAYDKSWGVG